MFLLEFEEWQLVTLGHYGRLTSPLFDLQKMTSFTDHTDIVRWNRDLFQLIKDMEKSLMA